MKYVFYYLTTLKYDCSSEGFIFIGLVKPVGLQGPVTSVDVSKFPCPSQVIDSSPEAIVIFKVAGLGVVGTFADRE